MYAIRPTLIAHSIILCAALAHSAPRAQTGTQLRIGLLTPSAPTASSLAIARGVRLGVSEAAQTAKLFGGDVQLYEKVVSTNAVPTAKSLIAGRHIQILIAASPEDIDALSALAETRHVVLLNVASRSNALRSVCRTYTFHIEASDAMYANAAPRNARDSVVLWDATLARFGASELNNRFARTFNFGMGGSSWAGWAAVKFASEAALRSRSSRPQDIARYFASVPTQFDGHKGWPLSFRESDHQLRQPLYMVVSGNGTQRRVTDIPDLRSLNAGMAGNASVLLDRLIPNTSTSPCKTTGAMN